VEEIRKDWQGRGCFRASIGKIRGEFSPISPKKTAPWVHIKREGECRLKPRKTDEGGEDEANATIATPVSVQNNGEKLPRQS